MKNIKKIAGLLLMIVMVFAMVSCGGGASEESGAEQDGQNPIMNLVGTYACERASILIEPNGDTGVKATVTWGSSAAETSEWVMTGTFDSENLVFEYSDCVRTNCVYAESGDIESQEEVYTGGHGYMFFTDGEKPTISWQDDQEHMADDMTFEYAN